MDLNHEQTSDMYLSEYGKFFGMLERKLFVQTHLKGLPSASLKKTFLTQYGITARQFNSVRIQLDGKVSSYIEKRKIDIQELESKIVYLQKMIEKKTAQKEQLHQKLLQLPPSQPSFLKLAKKYKNLKTYLFQKKRRLRNLTQKLEKLKSDATQQKIRICFGSKKLFHKQFHLEENKYKTHRDWKKDWEEARSSQFFVVGSKDETFGNQNATYDLK
ncbi:hypothetical protein, partial [Neobacillus sp. NPDC093127]|uniref:hypothetical protein n=1 Tax=Neobacillus sp. NPDC093127 TaxID=3364296 RepID=UPI00381C4395